MADLKSGVKSTEWWGIVLVAALAVAKSYGIIPKDATVASLSQQSVEAMPALINGLVGLAQGYGPILAVAGLVYAYIKRRTALKGQASK